MARYTPFAFSSSKCSLAAGELVALWMIDVYCEALDVSGFRQCAFIKGALTLEAPPSTQTSKQTHLDPVLLMKLEICIFGGAHYANNA